MPTNPFLGYGRSVTGNRLVGREHEIDNIVGHILERASINIVGEPRVGKSSVVSEAVRRARRADSKIPIVEMSLSLMQDAATFYRNLMNRILEACEDCDLPTPPKIADLPHATEDDAFSRCERGLRMMASRGVCCVVVLDEFDFVRKWGGEWKYVIRCVREFVTDPKYGFTGVFVSQRTMSEIEVEATRGGSTLTHSTHEIFIKPLPKAGIQAMCARCLPEWTITPRLLQQVMQISGGHPYIAEMLLFAGWEPRRVNLSEEITRRLTQLYRNIQELHSEDGLFELLVHVAHESRGPSSPEQRTLLTQYGLTVPSRDGDTMHVFSEHFRDYLQNYRPIVSTLELLRRTEITIRSFIEENCSGKYGAAWLQRIFKQHPGIGGKKEEWERRSLADMARYGRAAPLLSYSYPMDLWEIVSGEWDIFRPLLGRNKQYWNERFTTFAKVRNPVAHHFEEILPKDELERAERYCNELQQTIEGSRMPANVVMMQRPSA
jgi:hypothetical protein